MGHHWRKTGMWEGAFVGSPVHPRLRTTDAAVSVLVGKYSQGTCASRSSWATKTCRTGSCRHSESHQRPNHDERATSQQTTHCITETQEINQHRLWSMQWWKITAWPEFKYIHENHLARLYNSTSNSNVIITWNADINQKTEPKLFKIKAANTLLV